MANRRTWESRVALAMLPLGATMTLASLIAFVVVALLAVDTLVHPPAAAAWLVGWCLAALAVALRNTVKSIETMSSFEWRPLRGVAALSAAITAAYPGWWIDA